MLTLCELHYTKYAKYNNDSSVMFLKQRSDNPNKFTMHTSRVIRFVTASRFIISATFLTVKRIKRERGGGGGGGADQQTGTSMVKNKLFLSFRILCKILLLVPQS